MARQAVGLRRPRPGDAEAVPTTGRRRPLWRATHRRHPHPWWFSSRTDNPAPGRFDLAHPRGCCYWGLSPAAAIIEVTADPDLDDPPVLSLDALAGLAVWRADDVPAARSGLADATVASVPTLTGELATIASYELPWAWADAFDAAARSGVLYTARFGQDESIALFGHAGAPDRPPPVEPSAAVDHYHALPPGFRAGIGTVGTLDQLPKAPPP